MPDTEIFSFDIAGDRFIDKALEVAACNWTKEEGSLYYGWREHEGILFIYNKPVDQNKYDWVHVFPAPLNDVKNIIIAWLKDQPWSTSGQDYDVHYKKGYRIYNKIPWTQTADYHLIGFAVEPYWTEYHK